MKKEKEPQQEEMLRQEETEKREEEVTTESTAETTETPQDAQPEEKKVKELQEKLAKAQKESDEYLDKLRRSMAEFDNFRKRTVKEKEQERNNGAISVLLNVLPLLDNLERAMAAIPEEDKESAMSKGIQLVYQQFVDGLKNLGAEEIPAQGQTFDPNFHNAVTHEENEEVGDSVITEVFQKGYTYKGQVIRYSMVKVAN